MIRVLGTIVLVITATVPVRGQARPRSQMVSRSAVPLASTAASASSSPSRHGLYQPTMTWYEFLLHELNPHDRDWGAWYEDRREALVNASLRNTYFWYSLWVSVAVILLAAGLIKSLYDQRREMRIMGEQMDEVKTHDAYSRRVAHEIICQYNEHIELCNRAIEVSEIGQSTGTAVGPHANRVQPDPNTTQAEIELLKRDKTRLEAEVQQRQAAIPDLSRRIDALSERTGGNGQGQNGPETSAISNPEVLRLINELQQQLHLEREKNKRLKGGQ